MRRLTRIALSFIICTVSFSPARAQYRLWYDRPAQTWTQALPVGNGVIGGMVYGTPAVEHIALNEETIWAGQPNNVINPNAKQALPEVRRLIFEGKYKEAQQLADTKVMPRAVDKNMGMPFQPFGDLWIAMPGHADYTYMQKYGTRDYRGGGRASGRETAARVVGGSIAKMWLKEQHIAFSTRRDGRLITCTISGLPAGIGSPIFDRLNARLAYAVLSIPSAQSFVTGENPDDWQLPNDQYPDQWTPQGTGSNLTLTNHCGGIQGGISNGMPVVFHVGFHPPVTQPQGMTCRKADGTLTTVAPGGRHDVDHSSRLPVIVESMAALAVADSLMAAKAYNQQP